MRISKKKNQDSNESSGKSSSKPQAMIGELQKHPKTCFVLAPARETDLVEMTLGNFHKAYNG